LLYSPASRNLERYIPGKLLRLRQEPFSTAYHPPPTASHPIHLFFFEISYEGEYKWWKPLIVFRAKVLQYGL